MSILTAIFFGLVHGITEIIPVSGSGHLSVLSNLFGISYSETGFQFYNVLLHISTLAAILVVFWTDILSLVHGTLVVFGAAPRPADKNSYVPSARLFLMIVVATVPLFFIIAVKKYVDRLYYNTVFVGICFFLNGLLLFISDRFAEGKKTGNTIAPLDAILIGICQCVAVIPGISRSGVTLTSGLATGLKRDFAFRFCFLLSIPALFGSIILDLISALKEPLEWSYLPAYLIGMVVALLASIGALQLFKRILNKGKLSGIAYYCWVVGALAIILTLIF